MAESNTPSSSMPAIPPEANAQGPGRSLPPVNTFSSPVSIAKTHSPSAIQRWMHRINVLLFVFLCAVIGVLLVILPWRTEWMDNHLLSSYPTLRMIVGNAFTRGICSGLGVLDIWIGFWEAIHYHED